MDVIFNQFRRPARATTSGGCPVGRRQFAHRHFRGVPSPCRLHHLLGFPRRGSMPSYLPIAHVLGGKKCSPDSSRLLWPPYSPEPRSISTSPSSPRAFSSTIALYSSSGSWPIGAAT